MLKIDIDLSPGGKARVELSGTIEQLTLELNYILSNVYCNIWRQDKNSAELLQQMIMLGCVLDEFWTFAENADSETLN